MKFVNKSSKLNKLYYKLVSYENLDNCDNIDRQIELEMLSYYLEDIHSGRKPFRDIFDEFRDIMEQLHD